MVDLWKALAGQETAKRAIEIAIIGGHSVTLSPAPNQWAGRMAAYDIERLDPENRAKAEKIAAQYGGDIHGLEAARGACRDIFAACRYIEAGGDFGPPVEFSGAGALHIEVTATSLIDHLLPPPAEEGARLLERLQSARARLPEFSEALSYDAERLLDNWRAHCGAHDPQGEANAKAVARSIMALSYPDKGPALARIAIAEALSYRRIIAPGAEFMTEGGAI